MKLSLSESSGVTETSGALRTKVCLLAAAAIVLDGFDNQILSHMLIAIGREWNVPREKFAPVLATGLLGMSIGTIAAGWLGDRYGRKISLIGSLLLFGLFTMLCATTTSLPELLLMRLAAGAGLGGAIPNATVLISEFAAPRLKPIAVTLGIVCIPVGGVIAGVIASSALDGYGWRWLFVLGGVTPLVLACVLLVGMPESPTFLEARRGRTVSHRTRASWLGFGSLFAPEHQRDTIGLWMAFGACLAAVYSCFNWLPTILIDAGLSQPEASRGLAAYNLGGIFGAIAVGWLIVRFGSRLPVVMFAIGAVTGAIILQWVCFDPAFAHSLSILLVTEGALMNGVQVSIFAIAAHAYPARFRTTGVGAALGVGRLAAVASPFITAPFVADPRSAPSYFVFIAVLMVASAAALLVIVRHIPRSSSIDLMTPSGEI